MIAARETSGSEFDLSVMLGAVFDGIRPSLPYLIPLLVFILIVTAPLPGRGAGIFSGRDPWRGFKFEARRTVLARAGGRCEAPFVLAWGRCAKPAEEVDHIYPWSKGGATVVSNGQALCKSHNRAKSKLTPPWWYVVSLERRRRKYYPAGEIVRVSAAVTAADRSARSTWSERKKGRA